MSLLSAEGKLDIKGENDIVKINVGFNPPMLNYFIFTFTFTIVYFPIFYFPYIILTGSYSFLRSASTAPVIPFILTAFILAIPTVLFLFKNPSMYSILVDKKNKTLQLVSEELTFNFSEIKNVSVIERPVGIFGGIRTFIRLELTDREKLLKFFVINNNYGSQIMAAIKKAIEK